MHAFDNFPLFLGAVAMVAAIIAADAPNDLTVTTLAQAMPYTWSRTAYATTG
jgi:hypothetical protein